MLWNKPISGAVQRFENSRWIMHLHGFQINITFYLCFFLQKSFTTDMPQPSSYTFDHSMINNFHFTGSLSKIVLRKSVRGFYPLAFSCETGLCSNTKATIQKWIKKPPQLSARSWEPANQPCIAQAKQFLQKQTKCQKTFHLLRSS